jgi:hypothetical protein
MPLFRRIEPELRPLIAYIVARAKDRGVTLNRTKLVKLLYLIDVERVRGHREPLTGLDWVFYHYGPYAFELIDTLEEMEGSDLTAERWNDSVLYRGAPEAPDGEDWTPAVRSMVDAVIDRYAPLDLHELLDYVYFRTGPMMDAERGQHLDLHLARDDPPRRPPAPLPPAARPDDVDERLALWRAKNAKRLAPLVLDPPGGFLNDPNDDLGGDAVRGRMHVPDGQHL